MQNFGIYRYSFDNIRISYGYNSFITENQNSVEDAHSLMQWKSWYLFQMFKIIYLKIMQNCR